jgi:hypothetical protein
MLRHPPAQGQGPELNAVAIKKGQLKVMPPAGFQTMGMGTVRCDGCGEAFFIWQPMQHKGCDVSEAQCTSTAATYLDLASATRARAD